MLVLILIILILFFPIPKRLFKSNKLDEKLYSEGNWHYVYERDGKILKVIKGLGDENLSLRRINLYSGSITCIFDIIINKIAYYYVWRSHKIKLKEFNNDKFFPKIYFIGDNYIIQEKINRNNYCSQRFKEQIEQLNKTLNDKKYVLDDAHEENFKMGNDGYLKVIDGEIFSKKEYEIYQKIVNFFKKDFLKKYKNANNINYWNVDKISAEKKCEFM